MAGRDETFDGPPPGLVLHAYSIRHAISNGFTTYDFLRGNEPYKYSFGARERRIRCVRVSTRSGRNLGERLDPRTVPEVLQRTIKLHQTGKMAEAERGYRQVLDAAPRNAQALYCFAQLMTTKGNHALAKRHYKTLLTLKPESCKIWLRLAQSLEAGHQFSEAAQAYREVIGRQPNVAAAHRNLGRMLVKLGRHAEAVAAFEAALALQPGEQAAESGLAHALAALGQSHLSRHPVLNGIHNGKIAAKPRSPSWLN
jgi:tetratricopeptide (TPR) repeat protein